MVYNSTNQLRPSFETELVDAPEQGTTAWHEWRKLGIGATDAAGCIGASHWSSPLDVYSKKCGLKKDTSTPESQKRMEWGSRIEELLVQKFAEQHPEVTDITRGRLYCKDGWKKCSLDAQGWLPNGEPCIIECKTAQSAMEWDPVPDGYYAQVQWQMYVTGIRKTYFAVLVSGYDYFEREVDYCPAYVDKLLEVCAGVWENIQSRTPPKALANPEIDKEAIAEIGAERHYGEPEEVDEELVEKYKQLKTAADEADEALAKFKNELGLKLLDVQKLMFKGKTFASWVERKGVVSIDKTLLQTKYPDVYNQCLKQGLPSRYIKYNA